MRRVLTMIQPGGGGEGRPAAPGPGHQLTTEECHGSATWLQASQLWGSGHLRSGSPARPAELPALVAFAL